MTLSQEQLDWLLALAMEVGGASARLAEAEAAHAISRDKRRTYRRVRDARAVLHRTVTGLAAAKHHVGVTS